MLSWVQATDRVNDTQYGVVIKPKMERNTGMEWQDKKLLLTNCSYTFSNCHKISREG